MRFSFRRLAVVVFLFVLTPAVSAADSRPNVVLCMTDDQGWGDVSYNGLTKIRTPNLDAMAAAGIRFDRFYAHPECSSTRASVLTGRHPNRMGVFWAGAKFRRQEITVAAAARRAGYATAHFGKWHLNGVSGTGKIIPNSDPLSPLRVGFDESFSVSNYFELDWTFGRNGVAEETRGDGSEVIVAETLRFIDAAIQKNKPFLAVVWFGSPHGPHRPLSADLEAAGGSAYYGELLAVDRGMGALRKGLRDRDVARNTLLWFNSDNGAALHPRRPDDGRSGSNGGLRGRKQEVWEGGIRVPCAVEWPARIRRPFVTQIPAGVVDIYPTVVAAVGADVPNQVRPLDGVSLLPLFDGKMKSRPSPMGFWQYEDYVPEIVPENGDTAWLDDRYKLVKPARGAYQLFDLVADRNETTDLAENKPEIVARMKRELDAWQSSVIRSCQGADYADAKP